MGLDILTERLQAIRRNQPASSKLGWFLGGVVCLDEFLKLLARNLTALAQFKNLLLGLIVTAEEGITVLSLVVAQLETAIAVEQQFIQIFKSAAAAAASSLKLFPFGDADAINCPPVQAIKEYVMKSIPKPDPSSVLPGNAKKYAKKYKQATQSLKELEFRVLKQRKQISKLQRKIEELRVSVLAWQAIVDAITDQFGV